MGTGDTGKIFTNTLTPRYILGDRMASVIWRLRYAYIGPRFLYCLAVSADFPARHILVTRECILRSCSIRVLHSARSTQRHIITDWPSNMYLKCILLRE